MRIEAGGHDRVGGERPAGRVDAHAVAEPERLAQDDLLGGERRVQLGGVHGPFEDAGALGGEPGGRRVGEVAYAEAVRLDAVVDAADPGGPFAQLAGRGPRRRGSRRRRRRRSGGQSPVRSGRTT